MGSGTLLKTIVNRQSLFVNRKKYIYLRLYTESQLFLEMGLICFQTTSTTTSGHCEYLAQILHESVQPLLRYFSLEPSGGSTNIHRATPLAML